MNWEKDAEGNGSDLCSANVDALCKAPRGGTQCADSLSPSDILLTTFNKVNAVQIKFPWHLLVYYSLS